MERSLAELQHATDVSTDETSALAATQGRIDELDGNPRAAIADYQRSLALWLQSHQDEHGKQQQPHHQKDDEHQRTTAEERFESGKVRPPKEDDQHRPDGNRVEHCAVSEQHSCHRDEHSDARDEHRAA